MMDLESGIADPASRAAVFKARKEEGLRQMEAQQAMDQALMKVRNEEVKLLAQHVEALQTRKNECLKTVKDALGIDVQSMNEVKKNDRRRSLVQFIFCVVILGCELDLLSFGGAFADYWSLDNTIVQALLVVMPCAYLLCVCIYMMFIQPSDSVTPQEDRKVQNNSAPGAQKMGASAKNTSDGVALGLRAKALMKRRNIRLEWYHFLPLARYILLIKSVAAEDIEGIFRANSLSSFTLGSCQMVGLVFTIIENGGSLDGLGIFVYGNIISQCVNWFITFLYFATSVSKTMQNSIVIDAYKTNMSNKMRNVLLALQVAIAEDAEELSNTREVTFRENGSSASGVEEGRLGLMREMIYHEIELHKRVQVDLKYCDPTDLLQIYRALKQQLAEEFSKS